MIKLLHIYGQEQWHGNTYLVGNKAGLLELKNAIEQALDNGRGETTNKGSCIYTNDGEGYQVRVVLNDTIWQSPFWENLALPYSWEIASEKRDDAIWPWKIWQAMDEE